MPFFEYIDVIGIQIKKIYRSCVINYVKFTSISIKNKYYNEKLNKNDCSSRIEHF